MRAPIKIAGLTDDEVLSGTFVQITYAGDGAEGGGSPPPPTPLTVNYISTNVGDPLGGDSITLLGTGFADVAGVTFDGLSATITAKTSTSLTVTTPAHAAGVVDLVIDAAIALSFEYWQPSALTPMLFLDRGGYSLVAGSSYQWVARSKNAGITQFSGFSATTGPEHPPVSADGYPVYVRTDGTYLDSNGSQWGSIVLGTGDMTLAAVFDTTDIVSSSSSPSGNEAIVLETGASVGLTLGDTTSNKVIFLYSDGAAHTAKATLSPVAGRHVVVARKRSGALDITLDGSTFVAGDTGVGAMTSPSGTFYLGRRVIPFDTAHDRTINGDIRSVCFDAKAWSDADVAKFFLWAAARHP